MLGLGLKTAGVWLLFFPKDQCGHSCGLHLTKHEGGAGDLRTCSCLWRWNVDSRWAIRWERNELRSSLNLCLPAGSLCIQPTNTEAFPSVHSRVGQRGPPGKCPILRTGVWTSDSHPRCTPAVGWGRYKQLRTWTRETLAPALLLVLWPWASPFPSFPESPPSFNCWSL